MEDLSKIENNIQLSNKEWSNLEEIIKSSKKEITPSMKELMSKRSLEICNLDYGDDGFIEA